MDDMNQEPPLLRRRLSAELTQLEFLCHSEKLTLGTLIEQMTPRSHAILTFFISLPFLLPIPLPGLSTPFGLMIAALGISLSLRKKPWLPRFLKRREISPRFLEKVFHKSSELSMKMERWIHPRGAYIVTHPWIRQLNGVWIALCGLLLALPLPPGTNAPPALAIVLLSIGHLEEDLLVLGLGYIAMAINLILFFLLFFFGVSLLPTQT